MKRFTPDWLIYGTIVLLIYLNATRAARHDFPHPPPPEELGELLPGESPRDPTVLVDIDAPTSGVGTAFAIDSDGNWLTARHVVDGCDNVGLKIGAERGMRLEKDISKDSDAALLKSTWKRQPIPIDATSQRQMGEYGFFFGFPQGKPGEAIGSLIGRHRLMVRGRYNTEEAVLAWTELGRTKGLNGSLGGLSGGPVLDKDGEVIGIIAAESPRRGRIYTVAPKNLREYTPDETVIAEPIDAQRYGTYADRYRRDRRIAQVICLVK